MGSFDPLKLFALPVLIGLLLLWHPLTMVPRWLTDDLMRWFAGLTLLALIPVILLAVAGVREALFPGKIAVTTDGVRYRGYRIGLRDIEEVSGAHEIRLIGDRRVLVIGSGFCRGEDAGAVAHEVRRLIIEAGTRTPLTGAPTAPPG